MAPSRVRVAAIADLHCTKTSQGAFQPLLAKIAESADILLIAGDLTDYGLPDEARVLAKEFAALRIPAVAVLGNHDFESGKSEEVRTILCDAGLIILDGDAREIAGIGIAGVKGFGGGFAGACGSDFGEPELKAFIHHTKERAERLGSLLGAMTVDVRIALLHYSPVEDTLRGERLEIYPFLGSYLLAEAIDGAGADLILHGHAHNGTEKGITPGGVPVRNVAQPVIKHAYNVYAIETAEKAERKVPV